MRNLAFFKPSDEISVRLLGERLYLPRGGLHCTILRFCINGSDAPRVVEALNRIETEPFEVGVIGIDRFGYDGGACFGLRLSRPKALLDLRTRIAESVRQLEIESAGIENPSDESRAGKYDPHFTIHYGNYLPRLKHDYREMKVRVDEYVLAIKRGNEYGRVAGFRLEKRV